MNADSRTWLFGLAIDSLHGVRTSLVYLVLETSEDHSLNRFFAREQMGRLSDRNLASRLHGVAINPAAYRREGNGLDVVLERQAQAGSVTRSKQLRFALNAAIPDGPDSVYDVFCRQSIRSRYLRVTCWTTAKRAAFFEKLGTRSSVYRAIHTATAKQGAVRRVHYCIYFERGNVRFEYFYFAFQYRIRPAPPTLLERVILSQATTRALPEFLRNTLEDQKKKADPHGPPLPRGL